MPIFAILVLDELDISQNNCISVKNSCGSKYSRETTSKNDIIEECENTLNCDTSTVNRSTLVKNIVIRNLFGSSQWDLPLYIDFDRKGLSKSLLMEIISEVEEKIEGTVQIWAIVLSSIRDTELIEELGLDDGIHSFINPVENNRSVYCFADVHTLLFEQEKQMILRGIEIQMDSSEVGLSEKVRLTHSDFEDLVKSGKKNNSLVPELETLNNVMLNYRMPKQTQIIGSKDEITESRILNNMIANTLEMFFPDKGKQVQWIRIWNDFVQLMTQHPPLSSSNHVFSDGFGEPFLSNKLQALDKMINLVNGTVPIKDKSKTRQENAKQTRTLQPFQKAILWTIQSLKSIYSHMQSYIITLSDKEEVRDLALPTNQFNFNKYDSKFYENLLNVITVKSKSNTNKFVHERSQRVQKSAREESAIMTKRPNLYSNILNSLTLKEDYCDGRVKEKKQRYRKLKQKKRKPSPPPTNPSTTLEYKLSVDGKVHIPLGHPQIERIKNKNRLEIVSKEPQIKIVYPDDPENMLLMLQQQQPLYPVSDQFSILQDDVEVMKQGSVKSFLQTNMLQEDYSALDGTTIVIRGAIENNGADYVKRDDIDNKLVKNDAEEVDNERNDIARRDSVDLVDADGHINDHYYIQ